MIELSPWDTLLYVVLIITLVVALSKLLAESPPAVRIRDNKVINILAQTEKNNDDMISARTQVELHRLHHQVPAPLQRLRDVPPHLHRPVLLSVRGGGLQPGQVHQDGGQEGLLQDCVQVQESAGGQGEECPAAQAQVGEGEPPPGQRLCPV